MEGTQGCTGMAICMWKAWTPRLFVVLERIEHRRGGPLLDDETWLSDTTKPPHCRRNACRRTCQAPTMMRFLSFARTMGRYGRRRARRVGSRVIRSNLPMVEEEEGM
eukprot:5624262-Amphidinium_carterae.1